MFCATGFAWSADNASQQKDIQQQVIQPEIERRTIDIDKIDTEDFEIGVYAGLLSVVDYGANTVIGARIAYHVTEDVFFEAAYAKSDTSKTSYERLSGGAPLLTSGQRELTYYNISIGYNLLQGEAFIGKDWAFNTALYVIGGAGNTSFGGGNAFTFNYGVGYRFLVTDWLAVHVDVRDHIFNNNLLGYDNVVHNLETHGGVTVFF
jgi:outer membrane beta-barrel protein